MSDFDTGIVRNPHFFISIPLLTVPDIIVFPILFVHVKGVKPYLP